MSAVAQVRATRRGPLQDRRSSLVGDVVAVFLREMFLVLRDPFSLIFSLVQPLVFLALFGPLLGGSVDPAALGGQSPLQWFLPGVIVMICLFGTGCGRVEPAVRDLPRLLRAGAGQSRCDGRRS